jgi:hypothetical protein
MGGVLKRLLFVGIVVAGVALVARYVGPKLGPAAERAFENMPDDAPPKWMFNNITAIREQTTAISEQNERIVELLEGRQPAGSVPTESAV